MICFTALSFKYLVKLFFNTETLFIVNQILDLVQSVVIITATIFTASWTYQTFGHREKISALKKLQEYLESHCKSLRSYFNLVETKKNDINDKDIDQNYIDNLNKLISRELQSIWHYRFEMERFLDRELDLDQNFRDEFRIIAKPLFDDHLTDKDFSSDINNAYNQLRSLIFKSAKVLK